MKIGCAHRVFIFILSLADCHCRISSSTFFHSLDALFHYQMICLPVRKVAEEGRRNRFWTSGFLLFLIFLNSRNRLEINNDRKRKSLEGNQNKRPLCLCWGIIACELMCCSRDNIDVELRSKRMAFHERQLHTLSIYFARWVKCFVYVKTRRRCNKKYIKNAEIKIRATSSHWKLSHSQVVFVQKHKTKKKLWTGNDSRVPEMKKKIMNELKVLEMCATGNIRKWNLIRQFPDTHVKEIPLRMICLSMRKYRDQRRRRRK